MCFLCFPGRGLHFPAWVTALGQLSSLSLSPLRLPSEAAGGAARLSQDALSLSSLQQLQQLSVGYVDI